VGDYPISSSAYYALTNLVQTTDGNYVVSDDFFVSNEDDFSGFTRVSKVGSDGVFHWSQLFQFIDSAFDRNRAYDLKATSDGGVVFCGESTDLDSSSPNYESPGQRGWIVKLDACGCLVPGCNELCITEGVDDMHLPKFLLGPNPTAANLHVFIPTMPTSGHREIRIYNLMGELVTSFATPHGDTTYIVDMAGFADSYYFVSLFENNKLVYSEKVVKTK
jgi:Secretion system C-terminal sorting domain